jgi:hypothetical protein
MDNEVALISLNIPKEKNTPILPGGLHPVCFNLDGCGAVYPTLAPDLGCPTERADDDYNKSQQPHTCVPKS